MECLRKAASPARLQIFGTDLSEAVLARARAGLYPASAIEKIPPEWVRRYFAPVKDQFQISRKIRDLCTFARQNVPQDPPFSRLDLISCRNVLIYLGPELQRRCFPIFHYSLKPGGYLLLGTAETVGGFGDLFTQVEKRCKIYRKKSAATARVAVDFGTTAPALPEPPKMTKQAVRGLNVQADIQNAADRVVLNRVAPCGVIINANLHVLQFRGQTGDFLEHFAGEATLNLLQMARPALAMDLRAAIHKAQKDDVSVKVDDIPLQTGAGALLASLEVIPFYAPSTGTECWMLVLFRSRPLPPPRQPGAAASPGGRTDLAHLRDELRLTKESLQSIIEEQEATNEELKSANEEIESSNEELQSSNEELETAKEELQSTNEELQTLNEELNTRNHEMVQVNNDLQNLLSSINLPILMVDNELCIRRANPQAEKLFNLIPSDIGRRLSNIKSNLQAAELDQMIREVIDSLETREMEVRDQEDRTYSLRIRPYRTRDNRIDGAVVTLFDIDAIKRARAWRRGHLRAGSGNGRFIRGGRPGLERGWRDHRQQPGRR